MGLQPLEFSDCLTDSPYFREKLHTHEKELDRTSKAIKVLINECKDLVNAAKALSKAQRTFSKTLIDFKFECIGSEQTEDEECIANALGEFGKLISLIEDERDRMMDKAYEQIINPLEAFRKKSIGSAKDGKKKFDKYTAKFCTSLEKYLAMKNKTSENMLNEADVTVDMERRHFYAASMEYVLLLQETQETKKFEFVEILLRFIYQWLTFYHLGHDVSQDFKPYMSELQQRLQKCRTNYDTTKNEAEMLMKKMLEVRGPKPQEAAVKQPCTREGYLYCLEKKALGTTWSKYYCTYMKDNKILTMIPYNQVTNKGVSGFGGKKPDTITTDTMILQTCTRRASESIDKRFCFEITVQDRQGATTLQALSEEDRKLWLDAMDGKEPIYSSPSQSQDLGSLLDDIGFTFIKKCIGAIESNGLEEQGLYRVVGVSSKVTKLLNMGLDRRKADKINFEDSEEWEVKTITSALKNYFRNLPEPIMTFKLHPQLVTAAKRDVKTLRVEDIHELVHLLPEQNFEMLKLLINHLRRIADQSDKNLMTVPNLGVCFGPTLMRPREETMAAIMDIKWCNIVVETLIDNCQKIFETMPENADISNSRVLPPPASSSSSSNHYHPPALQQQQSCSPVISSSLSTSPPTNPGAHNNPMSTSSPNVFSTHNSHNSCSERDRVDSMSSGNKPPVGAGGPIYANMQQSATTDPSQTYAQYRAKLRPTAGIYSQFSPGDHNSSRSSSTESLNSRSSSTHHSNSSINHNHHPSPTPTSPATAANMAATHATDTGGGTNRGGGGPPGKGLAQGGGSAGSLFGELSAVHMVDNSPRITRAANRYSQASPLPKADHAAGSGTLTYYGYGKRRSADSITFSMSSSTSSVSSISSGQHGRGQGRRVRTLYQCEAENGTELSFEPNQIIQNVRPSREPGWLEGSLDGKTGLIPANYVEYLN